ncbi:MAG: hypothetical protein KGQ26_06090 [Rhodospirillales bacterium]|nr:hypothetical protein [Rhodospirillales bacterium]MDE2318517.1 hypothetical protein [Rhodospirillales bacterium]
MNATPQSPAPLPRWIISGVGLVLLALFVFLFQYAPGAYFKVMNGIMGQAFSSPFIDAQQVPAVIACSKMGVDVFVAAPCDPLGRPFAYSPLFLLLTWLPAWRPYMGIVLDAVFFLSLALLPAPRNLRGALLFILALCSGKSVFALERGNMDVVVFILVALGGRFWLSNFCCRLFGYAVLTLAGLLKFYPLTLFLLFCRERLFYFFGLALAGIASVVAFVLYYHKDLIEMSRNLPTISPFADGFGASDLPLGLQAIVGSAHLTAGSQGDHIGVYIVAVLILLTFVLGIMRLRRSQEFTTSIGALPEPEFTFLVIGSILLTGCFLAGGNNGYRGVELIFVVPGLAFLADAAQPKMRALFRLTLWSVIFVMWQAFVQQLVEALFRSNTLSTGYGAVMCVYWIIYQLAWWWITIVFTATILCFLEESLLFRTLSIWKLIRWLRGVRHDG